jgi:hypothetical protein
MMTLRTDIGLSVGSKVGRNSRVGFLLARPNDRNTRRGRTGSSDPCVIIRRMSIFPTFESGGQKFEQIPVSVSAGGVVTPSQLGSSEVTFDFAARPGSASERLADLDEAQVVARAFQYSHLRERVLAWLGLDHRTSWCIIGVLRQHVSRALPEGKPGDFDILAGRLIRQSSGIDFAFDYLAEAEVKRRLVSESGEAARMNERGTRQAYGAAELGFDRTLLLHLLVGEERDRPPQFAPSWDSVINADFGRAANMTAGLMKRVIESEPPFGYGILGWGQLRSTDPGVSCGICPVLLREPPVRVFSPGMGARREHITIGLKRLLARLDPRERFFLACRRCHELFALGEYPRCGERRCPNCREPF